MFTTYSSSSLRSSGDSNDVDLTAISESEKTELISTHMRNVSHNTIPEVEVTLWDALKEMFSENKINALLVFLFAYWSRAYQWSDDSIFILDFLAMLPLTSMLGGK